MGQEKKKTPKTCSVSEHEIMQMKRVKIKINQDANLSSAGAGRKEKSHANAQSDTVLYVKCNIIMSLC